MTLPLVDTIKLSTTLCQYPIKAELKYATDDNFVGRIINGYDAHMTGVGLLTPKAAEKLCAVQNYLINTYHYCLIIYDAYRPKRAVLDFYTWAQQSPTGDKELQQKAKHYPHITKPELFSLGYVDEHSWHCYGNTVDVFLFDLAINKVLDMGACFDYMDELSHLIAQASQIGALAYKNRAILLEAMKKYDFEPYDKEFWHYSHGGMKGREVTAPLDIAITPDLLDHLM